MLRHLKSVHLKMRPFQCSFWLKTFPRKERVQRHERIHVRNEQAVRTYEGLSSDAPSQFDNLLYPLPKISEKRMKEQQSAKLPALDILLDIINSQDHC